MLVRTNFLIDFAPADSGQVLVERNGEFVLVNEADLQGELVKH